MRHIDYKKNRLEIAAFAARIDKSKALERSKIVNMLYKDTLSRAHSPYFVNNYSNKKQQKKPFVCSLTKHEAQLYGYKLPHSDMRMLNNSNNGNSNNNLSSQTQTVEHHSNRKHQQWQQSWISGGNFRLSNRYNKYSYNNKGRKLLPLYNVLKTSSAATQNAHKRYPHLSSRNILDKYAHLFGLQPYRN